MTKSEYQELAEFIGLRFDRSDRRFDTIDRRLDAMDNRFDGIDERFDSMDERLRRVEILGEDTRHQVQIVAEAVTGNSQRLDAFRTEVSAEFRDVRELIQVSHGELDRRVTTLENRSEA
jgi:hypothetical protein